MVTIIKKIWAYPNKKEVLQELKQIAKANPKKFVVDATTLFGFAKSFESHSIIGNQKLNELGLHRFRIQQAARLAEKRREKLTHFLSQEDVEQFQKNGFILKENFLPEDEFIQLSKELLETPLQTRETLQGDTVTRRMALDGDALKQLPTTEKLLNDKKWQGLLNYVASSKIQPMYYVQAIFSQVRKSRPDPQTNLHSDTFHSSVKAWLFLTDVSEDEGPFVYVPGSHIVNAQRLQWEYQQSIQMSEKSNVLSRRGSLRVQLNELDGLGYGLPQTFAVKKNTLVIADTYGFHARGASIRPSKRIELWAYGRRSPFLPWVGWNILSIPIVKMYLVPIYWKVLDFLEKKYKRKNPWKNVGKLKATDDAVFKSK
jgi:hypothetical protein